MKKLRKSEIKRIIKENAALSTDELLKKYYDIVYYDYLGSTSDLMENVSNDERKYYMCRYAGVLERMLNKRGVNL